MLEKISEEDLLKRDEKKKKAFDARISRHQDGGKIVPFGIMILD